MRVIRLRQTSARQCDVCPRVYMTSNAIWPHSVHCF